MHCSVSFLNMQCKCYLTACCDAVTAVCVCVSLSALSLSLPSLSNFVSLYHWFHHCLWSFTHSLTVCMHVFSWNGVAFRLRVYTLKNKSLDSGLDWLTGSVKRKNAGLSQIHACPLWRVYAHRQAHLRGLLYRLHVYVFEPLACVPMCMCKSDAKGRCSRPFLSVRGATYCNARRWSPATNPHLHANIMCTMMLHWIIRKEKRRWVNEESRRQERLFVKWDSESSAYECN